MLRALYLIIILGGILGFPSKGWTQSELPIIPLPTQITPAKTATSTSPANRPAHQSGGEILPLPADIPPAKTPGKGAPTASEAQSLIPLPPPKTPPPTLTPEPPPLFDPGTLPADEVPPPPPPLPGEIVVKTQDPAQPAPAAPTAPPTGPTLPIFPKDTSSAIFMVMKTWECENYDGKTLLSHSINVYGQEAEDPFTIQGLDQLPSFAVTLKEDDITLDELLDIVAQKSNTDWGVDIQQKIIYFYPAPRQ